MSREFKINKDLQIGGGKSAVAALFFIAVFLFFCVFFINIHPLFPYSSDDWLYMSRDRWAIPNPCEWNPGKVFPEFMMPLISQFAAFAVYPLIQNYFLSLTCTHAVVVSGFLAAYFVVFHQMLTRRFGVSQHYGLLVTGFFLLLHFLLFRVESSRNEHLFYAWDLNCYYNYVIPNVVNAMVVMSLITHDWLKPQQVSVIKGCFLTLVIYLALFSNLYSCEVLVIFIGCQLIIELPCRNRQKAICYLRNNWMKVVIILLFFGLAALEATGKRSQDLAVEDIREGGTFVAQLMASLHDLAQVRLNKLFWMIFGVVAVYGVWEAAKKRSVPKLAIILALTIALTLVYIALLSAKANPEYVKRADVLFAAAFPLLLLTVLSIVKLFRQYPKCALFLPILMMAMFSRINMCETTFKDIGDKFGRAECLQRVNESILQQMKAASLLGQDSVSIIVPNMHTPDPYNHPYSKQFFMHTVSWTLEKHGIISRHMEGESILGKTVNEY